jgi:F-type H+-transporting ATPase subunit b
VKSGENVKRTTNDQGTTHARTASRSRAACAICAIGLSLLASTSAYASDALVLEPDPPLLLGLIIGFALLIFPANELIFKPIFKALDERTERIEGARKRATKIERDADVLLNDYETRIREARAEADTARKESITEARREHGLLTASARGEAETQIERARATLANDLETARTQMSTEARALAESAAEQILGRSLS